MQLQRHVSSSERKLCIISHEVREGSRRDTIIPSTQRRGCLYSELSLVSVSKLETTQRILWQLVRGHVLKYSQKDQEYITVTDIPVFLNNIQNFRNKTQNEIKFAKLYNMELLGSRKPT
jgi:hypothetical protein